MRHSARILLTLALGGALPAAAQTPAGSVALDDAPRRAAAERVRPGDRIVLKVFREEELSDSAILVGDRGEATFPKLGVVDVSAFTIATLGDSLRGRYARYLRDPAIDVTVLRRISVSGEVRRADVYYLDASASLRDAIAKAGGISPEGDPRKVRIVRGGETIAVKDWQSTAFGTDLRSGDQVYVGTKPWIARNVLGIVTTTAVIVSTTVTIIQAAR